MEYIMSPEELAKKLVVEINKADIDKSGDKVWTSNVKAVLKSIFHNGATEVIFTNREQEISEFMLDVIAWNRSEGEGLTLAVESEWSGVGRSPAQYAQEVANDFFKLLVVKASTKVMIFASDVESYPQHLIVQKLEEAFNLYKHHVKGERYIFIDFAPSPNRIAFWFEVPADGRAELQRTNIDLTIPTRIEFNN